MHTTNRTFARSSYHASVVIHGLRNDQQFLIRRLRASAADGALVAEPDREAKSLAGSSQRNKSEDLLGETHAVPAAKECSTRVLRDFWRDVFGQG